ncbi:diguanylate cyclase domain-containing protein [Massilia sp. TS11]|uniref:diguanylate cyclase domain-containing protein n=1 Tax=Massilia sp. TS11 TaxID=2908003 RepID=UPI001EDB0FC1|nr:diguanylate cyclase [Massilia sp. TS11]MCG2586190.1 diguanylate cyclase [Massilia sp. TS11]
MEATVGHTLHSLQTQPRRATVLLVDDQLIIVEAVRRLLEGEPDIVFHYETDGGRAAATAARLQPTVILQDLVMPNADGLALIQAYRAQAATEATPIIVLSAKDDAAIKAHSFAAGANDYVVKLPDRLELLARLRYHSQAYQHRLQRDEAFRFLRESQQKLAEANIELHKLAALDGLTGIANRRRFDEALRSEWARAAREQQPLSLLLCDVDCFKAYNDHYGHPAGDMVLKKVAAILTEHLKRPADLAARYGGEEFAILLPDTHNPGALTVAESCRAHLASLRMEHASASHGRYVTLSIGVATFLPSPAYTPEMLVEAADQALYQAKQAGRNRVLSAPI